MSKNIYEALVLIGAPALPEGYSYKIEEDDFLPWTYEMSILGPKNWVGYRPKQYLGGRKFTYLAQVGEKDRPLDPAPWFAWVLENMYARWRAVTYEQDMMKRFDNFVGVHP